MGQKFQVSQDSLTEPGVQKKIFLEFSCIIKTYTNKTTQKIPLNILMKQTVRQKPYSCARKHTAFC